MEVTYESRWTTCAVNSLRCALQVGWESTEQTGSSKRLCFSCNTKQLHLLQVLCYDRPPRSPNSEGWRFQTDVRTLRCSPPFSNLADKVTAFPVRWKGSSLSSHNESFTCEFSDFRYGVVEVFALLCWMQRMLTVSYRRFGTAYSSCFQGSSTPNCLSLVASCRGLAAAVCNPTK